MPVKGWRERGEEGGRGGIVAKKNPGYRNRGDEEKNGNPDFLATGK